MPVGQDKDFVAGAIDVKSTITETADEVADRIRQCLEYVSAELRRPSCERRGPGPRRAGKPNRSNDERTVSNEG
jgi:hypothetical protein